MKRFLLVLIILLLATSVQAKTFKVASLQTFSTQFPSAEFNVVTLEEIKFKGGAVIQPNTIISGKVIKIEKPRRGKRNAYFVFIPKYLRHNGIDSEVEGIYPVKIIGYRAIDPEKVAIYAAEKSTNFIFMGASVGVSFVKGAMQSEDGDRVKSGLVQIYKDTPLSFIETGSELNIQVGDALKFKVPN